MLKKFYIYIFLTAIVLFTVRVSCPPKPENESEGQSVVLHFESAFVRGNIHGIVCQTLQYTHATATDAINLHFHVTKVNKTNDTAKVTITCSDGTSHDITVPMNGSSVNTGCNTTPLGYPISVTVTP